MKHPNWVVDALLEVADQHVDAACQIHRLAARQASREAFQAAIKELAHTDCSGPTILVVRFVGKGAEVVVGSLDAARETPGQAGGEKVAAAVADVEAAEVDLAAPDSSNPTLSRKSRFSSSRIRTRSASSRTSLANCTWSELMHDSLSEKV